MKKLFSPKKIRNLIFKNRLIMSPMCMYCAENGDFNDWHFVHYASRAIGQCAAIIIEATAVEARGRISPSDLGIWEDSQIDKFKKIVDFLAHQNCLAGIQLAHAGRKASVSGGFFGGIPLKKYEGGWQTIAPSALPFDDKFPTPKAMTLDDIEDVVTNFTEAAKRAVCAGFKILDIHAAHGYLIHEFLSPISNKRVDEYGGSFENRIKFLVRIIESIKKNVSSDTVIFVRISATDWVENGWNLEDSIELCKILKKLGVDLIDVSTGGNIPDAKIPVDCGYQISFSNSIRKAAEINTSAVGLITSAEQAETVLVNSQADFIDIGRELLRDPYFPITCASELSTKIYLPPEYAAGFKKIFDNALG